MEEVDHLQTLTRSSTSTTFHCKHGWMPGLQLWCRGGRNLRQALQPTDLQTASVSQPEGQLFIW